MKIGLANNFKKFLTFENLQNESWEPKYEELNS